MTLEITELIKSKISDESSYELDLKIASISETWRTIVIAMVQGFHRTAAIFRVY